MKKKVKSELTHILDGYCGAQNEIPGTVDLSCRVYIRDAAADVHRLGVNGGTFANLVESYLQHLLHDVSRNKTVIDAFDQYDETNSVKVQERMRRQAVTDGARSYQLIPGRTVLHCTKFMSSSSNKRKITDFIYTYVSEHAAGAQEFVNDLEKTLYLAGCFTDGRHTICISSTEYVDDGNMAPSLEEADTRMIFHVKCADEMFELEQKSGFCCHQISRH